MIFGKDWRQRRKERKAKLRENPVGDPPFQDYQEDKFFTRPIHWPLLIIPEGYAGVWKRMGKVGEIAESHLSARGIETDEQGRKIEVTARAFPYGGAVRPGIKFMLSLWGLWSSLGVVDMRQRTHEVVANDLTTSDSTPIPTAKATVNYHVVDPVRALTGAKNYRFTLEEAAQARIREVFVAESLDQLTERRSNGENLAVQTQAMRESGVRMDELKITDFTYPPEMKNALAAQAIERAKAAGRVAQAQASYAVSELHKRAGVNYAEQPEALEVLRTEAARSLGKGFYYVPGVEKIAQALSNLFGQRNQNP